MRVKYIKSADLGVMESTVNLLLSQDWERDSCLMLQPDGEYLITLYNPDRPPRGMARAMDSYRMTTTAREGTPYPDHNSYPGPEPEQGPELELEDTLCTATEAVMRRR